MSRNAYVVATLMLAATLIIGVNFRRNARAQSAPASGKVAVVDIEAFESSEGGIKRLVEKLTALDAEFKPKREEIQALTARYEKLIREINDSKAVAAQQELERKADEVETIKRSIERKQQDGQSALEKRVKEVTDPIYSDINQALQTFARQRNIDVVFDLSKLKGTAMVVNADADITRAFINDYNSRNPGTP